ncbi:N-acetylmuramoyl-L-alanine amidase LytC precursor [Oxobacter pfennigii]|uniref:N-acetylmuramoyl-L-alanine amidase LytC n=1 Tax=Oxobacter pfennigii TaxID=36849 RepID=A0A0P8W930_9CLOT|nr:cell wall-binding repeat-containing protein [Oxobacter pfennigii]KPU45158.1 N-acetylmuramoyl-L-alanine amidase LytC precursor [Oxobacter pfennigii]
MPKKFKRIFTWCLVTCLILTQTIVGGIAFAETSAERLYGQDRYQTAVAISQKGWPSGSDYAIIARGDDFADALCAGPLAKKYDAPILLTETSTLNANTLNELKRLGVKNVIIVGGTGAVSENVEIALTAAGIASVVRFWGADRYETSVKIAEKIGTVKTVVLATGENYPDALSIAPVASANGWPIILTMKDTLPSSAVLYMNTCGVTKSYVVGGTGVIGDLVYYLAPNATRLGGADRYATNVLVMDEFKDTLNFDTIYLAVGDGPSGNEFADALSGAALAAKTSSPVVLAYQNLAAGTLDFLKANTSLATEVISLGGEAVMPSSVANSITALIPVAARYDSSGVYGPAEGTETINGNVVIAADGVTLQNVTIEGDLLLAKAIGLGTVNLNNVTVKGTTTVKGGGTDSIIMYNFNGQTVVVDVPDGHSVRLVASGSTTIADVVLNSGGKLGESELTGSGFVNVAIPAGAEVTLVGDFDTVEVEGSGAKVTLSQGSIKTLNIDSTAANAAVDLAEGTSVTTLNVSTSASVSGKGTINTANINANGVTIEQKPKTTNVASGVSASVGGKTVTGTPSTGGGGGGGGGNGDDDDDEPAPEIERLAGVAPVNGVFTLDAPYNISGATIIVSAAGTVTLSYDDDDEDDEPNRTLGQWSFSSGSNELTVIGNASGLRPLNILSALQDADIDVNDIADAIDLTAILNAVKNDDYKAVIYDEVIPTLLDGLTGQVGNISSIYEAIGLPTIYDAAGNDTQEGIQEALAPAIAVYVDNDGIYSSNAFATLVGDDSEDMIDEINSAPWSSDFYEAINFTILTNALINSSEKQAIYDAVNLEAIYEAARDEAQLNPTTLYAALMGAFHEIQALEDDTKEIIEEQGIDKVLNMLIEDAGYTFILEITNSNGTTRYTIEAN